MSLTRIVCGGIVVAALTVAGCSSSAKPGAASSPSPDKSATETNVVLKTPQACLDALDEAEKVFDISAEFAGITSSVFTTAKDAVTAAATGDVDGINQATDEIEQATADIENLTSQVNDITPSYRADANSCRTAR